MILIELLLLLTTFFPIYHLFTALKNKQTQEIYSSKKHSFSILVPCYNESICIKKTVTALQKLDYDNYQVVFINDGSRDNTLEILAEELCFIKEHSNLHSDYYRSLICDNFYCIDKPNTGKALSLNEGIRFCTNEIVITLDADSILNPDCLAILNQAFSNKEVVAAGGAIHIMQSKEKEYMKAQSFIKKLLIKVQAIDYLKGFFIYKLSLARQDALAIISGAFGAFRKSVLIEVGGFRKSLGEDIDITIKIQKHIADTDKKIVYLPSAGCYTECPESLSDLYKQRIRWQKGFIDCLVHHSKFLLSTCFKKTISFFLIFEALFIGIFSCILPIFATIALVLTGKFNAAIFIFLFCKIISIFYSLFAYLIGSRYRYPYSRKYYMSIIFDAFLLKPFLSFVYFVGTFGYLINKTSWKKTKRSALLAEN